MIVEQAVAAAAAANDVSNDAISADGEGDNQEEE